MEWVLLVVGLEFPVVMALLDCANRPGDHFAGGADDRHSWLRWLAVAVPLALVLVGYGVVLAYYYQVVKKQQR